MIDGRAIRYAIVAVGLLSAAGLVQTAAGSDRPRRAFEGKNVRVEFEGVVLERLPSPRIWSGVLATFQGIRYRVDKVLAGPTKPGDQIVYHVLVGPPLCESGEAILSQRIFKVGQRLHVRAERTPAGDYVGWENADSVLILLP
jgi:hypothetical protein